MAEKQNRLLIVIVGFIFIILVGISLLGFWGWNIFTDQAKDAFNQNPVILFHIGEVDKINIDLIATGDAEGDDVFVFRIEGSKGSGVVTAEIITLDDGTEGIRSGWIILPSGDSYDLL